MINYLINNAEELKLDILDERKLHDRLQIFFSVPSAIKLDDCSYFHVQSIITDTKYSYIDVAIDDEEIIGTINDIDKIQSIMELPFECYTLYKREMIE